MEDLDYEELDPGIRRTVRWLRSLGYETCDSGDGETKVALGHEDIRDHAHVVMTTTRHRVFDATFQLVETLRQVSIFVQPIGKTAVCIQATYDPADGTATIDLMNLDDSMLPPGVGEP